MRISDVFSSGNSLIGLKITIDGIFVMNCGAGYFVENMDAVEKKNESILIVHDNLENTLLSCVPAFGGGKISYCDKASISGFLNYDPSNDPPYLLSEISEFIIYKYDEEFRVKL